MKRKIKEVIKEDKEKEEKDSLFNEIKFKSQAAMEYLMTYGWAILIIALTLAVLYSLGIMNPKNFIPRAPPGSCFVFRPNGPGTTDFVSLQGTCGYLPMYVGSFNGVNSYVDVPNSPSLQVNGDLTISAWIKPTALPTYQEIVGKMDYRVEFAFGVYPTGELGILFGNGTSYNELRSSGANIQPNAWYHVVVTRDNTVKVVKFYINGKFISQISYTIAITKSSNNVNIGRRNAGWYYFNGLIDEVSIYNTALTPQEIQYLYQQGLGGGPVRLQNLVAWWPLNGDAKDYSGNNNHGTIYNVTFVQNYNPP